MRVRMDLKHKRVAESSSSSSLMMSDTARNTSADQPFPQFDTVNLSYGRRAALSFPEIPTPDTQPHSMRPLTNEVKKHDQSEPSSCIRSNILDWDPRAMLNNLSFLEQKIHEVQGIVHSIANQDGRFSEQANELAAQQQLVTADLTCIIIQLISAAGTLLPSRNNSLISANPAAGQLGSIRTSPSNVGFNSNMQQNEVVPSKTRKASEFDEFIRCLSNCGSEGNELIKFLKNSGAEVAEAAPMEDHDLKDSDDVVDSENIPLNSYEVLQLEKEEILAPHTHFCMICGKGFKRDANLRMHMRGHGDEYKTAAALAKPIKESNSEQMPIKRYSCPFVGCKRNKEHKKFQPLKTILCVKNHYKRSHCDKRYTCSRCHSKKFSVLADLKTHEKHCGRDKWICSCGTTFSRKDKLFGHVALFQGHTPALHIDEARASGASEHCGNEAKAIVGDLACNLGTSSLNGSNILDVKEVDEDRGLFSLMNFDSYSLDEFPRPAFDVSEDSFSFPPGSSSFVQRNGDTSALLPWDDNKRHRGDHWC